MQTLSGSRGRSEQHGLLGRMVAVALEGRHPWGYSEQTAAASPRQAGVTGRRLVVYPPGTTRGERRILTLARRWPVAGGLTALVLAAVLTPAVPGAALFGMLGFYLAGSAVVLVLARGLRRRCRTAAMSTLLIGGSVRTLGDASLLTASQASLTVLERRLDEGEIGEVEFELGWGQVYDALGVARPTTRP